jgi:signal transduction histidine kinase
MSPRPSDLLARAIADAAHDLRNLANVARSGSELLVTDDPLTADVHDAVEALTVVVDRVVESARTSQLAGTRREVVLLTDLLDAGTRRARRHGLQVELSVAGEPASVAVHSTAAERTIADHLRLVAQGAVGGTVTATAAALELRIAWQPRLDGPATDAAELRILRDFQPLLLEASDISSTESTGSLVLRFRAAPAAGDGTAYTHLATTVDADVSDTPAAAEVRSHTVRADDLQQVLDAPDLATSIARATELIQRERAEADAAQRSLTALVEAGKSLAQELTLRGVLRRIVELSCELVDCEYGALGVVDDNGRTLSEFITVGVDDATHAAIGALPRGLGLLGVLIEEPRPLRLEHMQADPRSHGFPPNHPPMESFLGVPIVTRRRVKGRLYLTEKRGPGRFTEADERVAMTLASQAAIAIENAELYEAMTETSEQLARANHELQVADRHKSAFLANMSHELRTPLNSIIGYASLLIEEPGALDAEQREDLRIIHASSTHLLGLIADLLDLSQIETGHVRLHLTTVDAVRAATDVAASLRPQAEAAETTIDVVTDAADDAAGGGVIELRCDAARLRQILLNVTANAVKFTSGGTITITVAQQADVVTFLVRDTGVGIPASDLDRIFESFFQSSASLARTPRAHEGAGLGLAITRDLAQLHGGTVDIASTEHLGTTVRIELPLAGPIEEPA